MDLRLLDKIRSPHEIKELSFEDLEALAEELRSEIIRVTSLNGGHIGASLSCVEMILALHRVFDSPRDSLVFDVGHQAYTHKLLTGRRAAFEKLRKEEGASGFTNRGESEYDIFGAGHAATSISAALGILEGKRQQGDDSHVVAVIGDGALTCGLAFEGFNNLGALRSNLIVVFNDNRMSIDPNVGALQEAFERAWGHARSYFEVLGLDYWGPEDGHDLQRMMALLAKAKEHGRPVVIHLMTEKGRGYEPAVQDKIRFHGCGPFDVETGQAIKPPQSQAKYQDIFAQTLVAMAKRDKRIVGITAAMPSGTSLKKFKEVFPQRFYDVGIAESHGVEFAAGLATQGMKPFVAIYSTFLQRAYDQLIHDVGLQNLPVRFCMDRGGLVGDDGPTHHGVFDYVYLSSIPNFVVMAPRDEVELAHMLETARLYPHGPIAVRYPRGDAKGLELPRHLCALPVGKGEQLCGSLSGDVLICAIGDPVYAALGAAKKLERKNGLRVSVIDLRFAKPLDDELIIGLARNHAVVVTVEEGVVAGGVGHAILHLLQERMVLKPVKVLGVPDRFIPHASQQRQRQWVGIDSPAIAAAGLELLRRWEKGAPVHETDLEMYEVSAVMKL